MNNWRDCVSYSLERPARLQRIDIESLLFSMVCPVPSTYNSPTQPEEERKGEWQVARTRRGHAHDMLCAAAMREKTSYDRSSGSSLIRDRNYQCLSLRERKTIPLRPTLIRTSTNPKAHYQFWSDDWRQLDKGYITGHICLAQPFILDKTLQYWNLS